MPKAYCYLFLDTITGKWRLRTRTNHFYRGEIPFKVVVEYELPELKWIPLEAKVGNLPPQVKEGIIEAIEDAQRGDMEEVKSD